MKNEFSRSQTKILTIGQTLFQNPSEWFQAVCRIKFSGCFLWLFHYCFHRNLCAGAAKHGRNATVRGMRKLDGAVQVFLRGVRTDKCDRKVSFGYHFRMGFGAFASGTDLEINNIYSFFPKYTQNVQ